MLQLIGWKVATVDSLMLEALFVHFIHKRFNLSLDLNVWCWKVLDKVFGGIHAYDLIDIYHRRDCNNSLVQLLQNAAEKFHLSDINLSPI